MDQNYLTLNQKNQYLNNVNGLTYIKGLLGISMILYIFGQTFIALFNLIYHSKTLLYQNLILH